MRVPRGGVKKTADPGHDKIFSLHYQQDGGSPREEGGGRRNRGFEGQRMTGSAFQRWTLCRNSVSVITGWRESEGGRRGSPDSRVEGLADDGERA